MVPEDTVPTNIYTSSYYKPPYSAVWHAFARQTAEQDHRILLMQMVQINLAQLVENSACRFYFTEDFRYMIMSRKYQRVTRYVQTGLDSCKSEYLVREYSQ